MVKDELLYPIFLECCKYTEDTFWKYILEDLAYGKTPYGTYITKNFLCCNYKGREFSYKIDVSKNSETLYNEVYNVLFNKFGLLSNKDKIKKRELFDITQQELDNQQKDNWNSIKKKSVKNILVENYIIDKKYKYNLTFKQLKKLLSIIIIGIIFKTITSSDIHYENSTIHDIDGFEFSNKKIDITKDIYDFNYITSPQIIIDKKLMRDNWDKFILNINKNYK
tara:strand:+ start:1328 stop:1996 length:669 start_codon:yes stop_codon:yes gene_type:complete